VIFITGNGRTPVVALPLVPNIIATSPYNYISYLLLAFHRCILSLLSRTTLARRRIASGFYLYTWWAQLVPCEK